MTNDLRAACGNYLAAWQQTCALPEGHKDAHQSASGNVMWLDAPEPPPHEFRETPDDYSMCVCGIPATAHDPLPECGCPHTRIAGCVHDDAPEPPSKPYEQCVVGADGRCARWSHDHAKPPSECGDWPAPCNHDPAHERQHVAAEPPSGCDHLTTVFVDDAAGWKCYYCGLVLGWPEPPSGGEVTAEELARVVDEADDRWQHGIGSSGYDPAGPPLWIAKALQDRYIVTRRPEVETVEGE